MSKKEQPPPETLGPYRIVKQLGQGGMGVVYEAVHEKISRRVAIKLLRSEYANDSQVAQRFFNEARAANLIEHPALVQISEFGQLPDGSTYLVMELLKGESLSTRLRRERTLPLPMVLRIGCQLAEALCMAHEKHIVHRDLKPENVMLVPDTAAAGGERVKLLDFGIAKLAEGGPNRTATSALLGTPKYMSPEQARGAGHVDEKTDVYALGVMLFELLSGRTPFNGQPGELIAQHLFAQAPSLVTLVPGLSPAMAELVARLLAKELEQRPDMVTAHRELQALLNLSTVEELQASTLIQPSAPTITPIRDNSTLSFTASQLGQVRRRAPLIAIGACVASVIVGGWMLFGGTSNPARKLDAPVAGRAPSAPAAAASSARPSAAPATSTVHWSIKTTPASAQILRASDEHLLGQTPWTFDPTPGSGEQEFIVRLKGYQDQILRAREDTDLDQTLVLERRSDAKKAARPKGASSSPAPLFTPKSWMNK